MKIIGVTGTSGSGKTMISKIIKEKYNAKVIDADKIVKEQRAKGNNYYFAILESFGKEILDDKKEIDTKKLADKIYNSKEERERLNELTYNYIVGAMTNMIYKSDSDIIIIDAPLLIECGLNKLCNIVISALADEETKIKRMCSRDGITVDIAKKRLSIQPSDEFYIDNSDYIIQNNEDKPNEEIEEEICTIIGKI